MYAKLLVVLVIRTMKGNLKLHPQSSIMSKFGIDVQQAFNKCAALHGSLPSSRHVGRVVKAMAKGKDLKVLTYILDSPEWSGDVDDGNTGKGERGLWRALYNASIAESDHRVAVAVGTWRPQASIMTPMRASRAGVNASWRGPLTTGSTGSHWLSMSPH